MDAEREDHHNKNLLECVLRAIENHHQMDLYAALTSAACITT